MYVCQFSPAVTLWSTSGEGERGKEGERAHLQTGMLRLRKPTHPTDSHIMRNEEVWLLCTIPKENPAWPIGSAMPQGAG